MSALRDLVLRPSAEVDPNREDPAVRPPAAADTADPAALEEEPADTPGPGGDAVRVVLAPRDRATLAGAAVASALGRGARGDTPVVAVWDPSKTPDHPGGTAIGRARRARDRAERCGVDAVAAGRIVRTRLPADDAQAVAALERLDREPGLGPLVVVLAGPWGRPFLATLERSGLIHADGAPSVLSACAGTLSRHGISVVGVPRPTGPVARALLRAGWTGRTQIVDDGRATEPCGDGPGLAPVRAEQGQALMLVLLAVTVAAMLAVALGGVAAAMGGREDRQRTVDLAALAAAGRMRDDWAARAGVPARMSTATFRTRAVEAARRTAKENGLDRVAVDFPDPKADVGGPLTVRVRARRSTTLAGVALDGSVDATAELAPPVVPSPADPGDEYRGPLVRRDGKPMRPDVGQAYDRMAAAARRAGLRLSVTSGYRSNAEQARLFAAHPDPKWVARPGTSLHRLGTELDLGPPAAYGWLAANAKRYGFLKRYSWEAWHFGYTRNPGSTYVSRRSGGSGGTGSTRRGSATPSAIPPWVPGAYRDTIGHASVRYRISSALLAAQLRQESGFNPSAVSGAGAQGIAQFMPDTARAMGLRDPFDPAASIHAQARMMAGLLRRFGSVQLALAAYNAGEGRVAACMCVPPIAETRHYVATIMALLRGYDADGGQGDALAVRLVE